MQDLKFRHGWRSYQQRVLDELDGHLDDAQLHVVAAPGSGKTVLGLEVMRRLGKPAVIFAPSLAIRTQWKARLVELFLPEGADAHWISLDIRRPGPVTIVTYQGFHAAMTGLSGEEEGFPEAGSGPELLQGLIDQGIGTLVFDEAHHLRKDWQRSLIQLKQRLPGRVTTVSLTATPPYDTDAREWDNYEALCGPIDCEISVPELVKTGDLCPHQDLVCFSAPTDAETAFIDAFAENLNGFAHDLLHDPAFLERLENLPCFASPSEHEDAIFKHAAFCLAGMVFLKAAGRSPSPEALALFSLEAAELPGLDREFLERLLDGVLSGESAEWFDPDTRKRISKELRSFGGLRGGKPMLANMDKIDRMLRNSLGKIRSIRSIVAAESSALGTELRMVILTDYIHRDLVPSPGQRVYEPVKIGAVPLFEVLRQRGDYFYKVGLLTGSLVILPVAAMPFYQEAAVARGIGRGDLRIRSLPHDPDYVEIELASGFQHESVHLVTEVFEQGGVTVLVGTQSLLGEGWDAPCINSLVLASTVGSFMLSNQMRGRAIRTDPANPQKTANIWHLACVNLPRDNGLQGSIPGVDFLSARLAGRLPSPAPIREDLGQDAALLVRRFKAFEGLSVSDPPFIETGLGRLGFAGVAWSGDAPERLNGATFARSADRSGLVERWSEALFRSAPEARLRPMAAVRRAPQTWVYRRAVRTSGVAAVAVLVAGVGLGAAIKAAAPVGIAVALVVFGLALTVLRKQGGVRSFVHWFRNRSLDRNLRQIGQAVLQALAGTRQLQSAPARLTPVVQFLHGDHLCSLDGAQPKEQALFLTCLEQLLGPVDTPKYLLVRRVRGLGGTAQVDFHPVPDALAGRKVHAESFLKHWREHVSPAELVSVRSREGRQLLLRARAEAYSSEFTPHSERLGRWQ
ncbi:DEAD/DEAH box helicase family protein [Roseibium sp. Sym1]|uniref:DEAD/DEAH box helicase family protein n=1 Tax=Roseibium sp. Sym1 TaxID=3016006 RepID=UPI0022B5353D|nr:DEAD/DEAH box helicase family protein [Roseibium sp. Sym1]